LVRPYHHLGAAESRVDLAFQDDEGLLEVVSMRRRSTTARNQHVDQTKTAIRVVPRDQDGVGVPHHTDVRKAPALSG
jgi:hypothetical protein